MKKQCKIDSSWKIIIFPTDTVYGIGCKITDENSIKKIYEIKHRPKDKPLACLCANLEQIDQIAILDKVAKKIIKNFMPGALTLILRARDDIGKITGFETIGVRIPNNKLALDILQQNGPMLTTSVNESGQVSMTDYHEIVKNFGDKVDFVFKPNGEKSSKKPSTVLKIESEKIDILREGEITLQMIENLLKKGV